MRGGGRGGRGVARSDRGNGVYGKGSQDEKQEKEAGKEEEEEEEVEEMEGGDDQGEEEKATQGKRRVQKKRKSEDTGAGEEEEMSERAERVERAGMVEAAGRDPSEGNLLRVLRNVFGFDRFRDGQVAAIQRVLRGQSTLLVLPTGAGKSLCYQLPAFLLPGLTLVVSPLVALMQDQLAHLPPCLPGALLSSFQSPGESGAVIERLRGGELKVLFVSPERLAAPSFLRLLSSLPQGVSLVVFDEAHCISEWSHNFRSAYLRLSSILLSSGLLERQAAAPEERKAAAAAAEEASDTKASSADPSFADGGGGAAAVAAAASDVEGTNDCLPGGDNTNSSNIPRRPCILAITATATRLATSSLIAALGIPPGGVIRRGVVRPNLHLSVSITGAKGLVPGTGSGPADVVGENKWGGGAAAAGHSRQRALVDLLAAPPFSSARSIIVYCSFQWEADDLARILRDNRIAARSYHGGLQAGERTRILQRFTANKLRVVVATLAFGMGLDKADVGAVVHYSIPRSPEQYVQEIGRAGRNGQPAFCHLFVDRPCYLRLRSLAHSDGVSESTVAAFLSLVFGNYQLPVALEESPEGSPEAAVQIPVFQTIPKEKTAQSLDIRPEVMETILVFCESPAPSATLASDSKLPPSTPSSSSPPATPASSLPPEPLSSLAPLSSPTPPAAAAYLRMMPEAPASCLLSFHKTPVEVLSKKVPLVKAILATNPTPRNGRYTIQLAPLANHARMPLPMLLSALRDLQRCGEIVCEFLEPSLCVQLMSRPKSLSSLAASICHRLAAVERSTVGKLDAMYAVAVAAAQLPAAQPAAPPAAPPATPAAAPPAAPPATPAAAPPAAPQRAAEPESSRSQAGRQTALLQRCIAAYFDSPDGSVPPLLAAPAPVTTASQFLRSDIKVFLRCQQANPDAPPVNARAVSRILHGLTSPAFPASDWSKHHFWGRYADIDFHTVRRIAVEELIASRLHKPARHPLLRKTL